ncbi:uncharacterized protein LOC136087499 [Hydra vulgaris]|uniref:Uncharacterized protein LOC136087499 n=1 Tax=Hydra vulgaris TaxID=6087 RepID=A0ABM4CWZ4_HYDVU
MASIVKKWKVINRKVNALLDSSSEDERVVEQHVIDFSLLTEKSTSLGSSTVSSSFDDIYSVNSDNELLESISMSDNIFLCDNAYLTDDYYPNSSELDSNNTYCYSSDGSNEGEMSSLDKKLAHCATRNCWTRSSVNELLSILCESGCP